MKIRLNITEDLLKLIRNFRFKRINDRVSGIDTYDLYGGTNLYEDMALILGDYDKAIEGTECNPTGRRFPSEIEEKYRELDAYIIDNLDSIENLVHQYFGQELEVGEYEAQDYEQIWTKRVRKSKNKED